MKKYLLLPLVFLLTSCTSSQAPPDLNMVVSVSSDGYYAIATNTNKQAILWDLQDYSYKIIFKDANIYSAYFIKNTNDFMYQNDKTNEVVIENVNGQIIKTFNPGFPTYGEVVSSDLKTYFASDRWFQLYKTDLTTNQTKQFFYYYCGPNYTDETPPPTGMPYACQEFLGSDQLFGLSLTPDNKTLISTASGAMYIWDVTTTKQRDLIIKNDAQTVAVINPQGNYVVTGDLVSEGVAYSLTQKALIKKFAYTTPIDAQTHNYFVGGQNFLNQVLTVKFIDDQHVLVFFVEPERFYFATLYDPAHFIPINYPSIKVGLAPIKYLPLIDDASTNFYPFDDAPLASDDFSRDQAIDTSPSAHILVMSQQNANGIIVYKYDPGSQTLTRVWAGTVKPWWQFW